MNKINKGLIPIASLCPDFYRRIKRVTKKIKEHKYIDSVLKVIPSNSIIEKPTGAGITRKEIDELRHSIILEANTPVITDKARTYNKNNTRQLKVRTVLEGVEVTDIVNYLQSDREYKKILSTPESWWKVEAAFKELGMLSDMYKNYFLLFDECERTIQDVDYREDIIKPIDDFFEFKNKAFVSATPIIPSDPRFEQQAFKHLIVEPDYDATQAVDLIITNNTVYSFEKYLNTNPKEQYFIFMNSTTGIAYLIEYLKIRDQSSIFCSKESKNTLKLQGFNSSDCLCSSDKFSKYNFFTSRFNSAVDILNLVDPNIIVISDLYLADHSKVDPLTELKQIAGRFRRPENGKITRYLTHITNLNPDLNSTPREQICKDVEGFKVIHNVLIDYRDSATSAFAKSVVDEMLKYSEFSKYIRPDGSTNYFMMDNAIHVNMVNGLYKSKENLIAAYNDSKSYHLKTVDHQSYDLTDEHSVGFKKGTIKPSLELILPILKTLNEKGLYDFDVQLQLKQLQRDHPTAYKAFNVIGFETAAKLKFDYRKILEEITKKECSTQHNHFGFLAHLKAEIIVGKAYTRGSLISIMKRGIKKFNLSRLTANMALLDRYFIYSNRVYIGTKNQKRIYGYRIISFKFGKGR